MVLLYVWPRNDWLEDVTGGGLARRVLLSRWPRNGCLDYVTGGGLARMVLFYGWPGAVDGDEGWS